MYQTYSRKFARFVLFCLFKKIKTHQTTTKPEKHTNILIDCKCKMALLLYCFIGFKFECEWIDEFEGAEQKFNATNNVPYVSKKCLRNSLNRCGNFGRWTFDFDFKFENPKTSTTTTTFTENHLNEHNMVKWNLPWGSWTMRRSESSI